MKSAQGIITVRGGMTSHAAVVARGMGTCCVSGVSAIDMDEDNRCFTIDGHTFHEGDWISANGSTGKIYEGVIPTVEAQIVGEFGRIMGWGGRHSDRGGADRRGVRPHHGLGGQVQENEGPHERGHAGRRKAGA